MKRDIKTDTTTIVEHTAELSAEDIIAAFNLPAHARVSFFVPGGGDWSNTEIDLSAENPVHVSWRH